MSLISSVMYLVENHMKEFLEFWTPTIMITIGVIVFVLEAFCGMRAEYGRYNNKNFGFSAPIAWLFQESPAFLVPFGLVLYRRVFLFDSSHKINTNFLLLCLFLIHYFNRYY